MKVKVVFRGPLQDWTGTGSAELELPENALFGDLLTRVGETFGTRLPRGLWKKKEKTFAFPIMGLAEETQTVLTYPDQPLPPGNTIALVLALSAGG